MSEQLPHYNPEEERRKEILSRSPLTSILLNTTLRQTGKDVWWSQLYNQDQRFWVDLSPFIHPYFRNEKNKLQRKGREANILLANDFYNHWGVLWSMSVGFETGEKELFMPQIEELLKEFNIIQDKENTEKNREFIKRCIQTGVELRENTSEDEYSQPIVTKIPDIFINAFNDDL